MNRTHQMTLEESIDQRTECAGNQDEYQYKEVNAPCLQALGRTEGQATEIEIAANHILQTKKKLNSIMAENCGKTVEELTAATDRDNWLTAQEALEFGLVDKVIDKR